MKKFLSDYGFTILTAIVVITLIAFGSPISSTIQKQTANIVQSLGKVANNDLNKIDDSASLIDLTNINKSGVVGDFSRKGNLVTINDTQFRVLEVNGTQVKVMSMIDVGNSSFGSSETTLFGDIEGQSYSGSALDQAMTSYYNNLPTAIKTAIVPHIINQSMYTYPVTPTNKIGEVSVGKRYVYALDIDDILQYLESNCSSYTLNEMFFETKSPVNSLIWLRSVGSSRIDYAFTLYGNNGSLGYSGYRSNYKIRPAFIIDLSLLS